MKFTWAVGLVFAVVAQKWLVSGTLCFGEQNNAISVEVESTELPAANFVVDTSIPGYSGSSHVTYIAENRYDSPVASEYLEYKIFSKFGGDYVMYMRASRNREGTQLRKDEANDIWVNAHFSTVGQQWVKMYTAFQSTDLEWRTLPRAEFNKSFLRAKVSLLPGLNTILLSGRSNRYSPDKMIFMKTGSALDEEIPEMRVDCETGMASGATPTCETIFSRRLAEIYADSFSDKVCNFNRVANAGKWNCNAGACDGKTDTVCAKTMGNVVNRVLRRDNMCV